MKDKRGSITGIFLFMIVAFVLVVISVIFIFLGATIEAELLSQNETLQKNFPNANVTEVIKKHIGAVNLAYSALPWITMMLIIGMVIAIMISSFLVQENPVFFVLYIFLLIIAIVVAAILSNVYEEVYTNPVLASSFEGFFGVTFIFLNLHIWVTVIGFVAGIIMYVNSIRIKSSGGMV